MCVLEAALATVAIKMDAILWMHNNNPDISLVFFLHTLPKKI